MYTYMYITLESSPMESSVAIDINMKLVSSLLK